MNIYRIIFKSFRKLNRSIVRFIGQVYIKFLLKANNVKFGKNLRSNGCPIISVTDKGKMTIGDNFAMNNGVLFNQIGRNQKCMLLVGGELTIGNNVGMSSTAIVCQESIEIGDNVRIGGNTVIYDTDFHSLDFRERIVIPEITDNVGRKPVKISENVFIGAGTTILKGVTIGKNSIIGAGSVVVKDIPDNQIWGGNPAKFIKEITK